MPNQLSKSYLQSARDEYEEYMRERAPLTLDVPSLWHEDLRMVDELSQRFQKHGAITERSDLKCLTRWKWPGLWANYANEVAVSDLVEITREAFSLNPGSSLPSDAIIREQLEILCDLRGIASATATVLLTFWKPETYTVMDVRALSTLSRNDRWQGKLSANTPEYPAYLRECHALVEETGLSLRDVDRALWQLGDEGH